MSVTVNTGASNQPASFFSPIIPQSGSKCQVKFFYRFYSTGGSLNVSMSLDQGRKILLFRTDGYQPAFSWTEQIIDLGRVSNKFQIIFEATRTLSSFGYIVIDDISFENCALPYANATCLPNEFKCNRGSCVAMDRTCDFVDDCGDYSDEILPICASYQK